MAGNFIRINTDQVAAIADNLDGLNKKLRETLEKSKSTMNGLSNVWTGEAANETISSFNDFAGKYFQSYEEVIQQYVNFLRTNVEEGYITTENTNISLADAFK